MNFQPIGMQSTYQVCGPMTVRDSYGTNWRQVASRSRAGRTSAPQASTGVGVLHYLSINCDHQRGGVGGTGSLQAYVPEQMAVSSHISPSILRGFHHRGGVTLPATASTHSTAANMEASQLSLWHSHRSVHVWMDGWMDDRNDKSYYHDETRIG